ncbi:MAG TPA: hypothetical protein VML36_10525 [Nitrospiria bacterium]|nr:hypothetical protein [Nitrospiria bacterium]
MFNMRGAESLWLMAAMACAAVAGCAPQMIALSAADRHLVQKQPTLVMVYYEPPPFSITHPGLIDASMVFGSHGVGSGTVAATESGRNMVDAYGLQDPAPAIGRDVSLGITTSLNIRGMAADTVPLGNDEMATLQDAHGDAIVADFKTLDWGLTERKGQYSLRYTVRSRLLDLRTERVLWQGLCEYGKQAEPMAHRLLELTANDGGFLKQILSDAASVCAEVLLFQFRENGGS